MRKYFEEQIRTTKPLTKDGIDAMRENRIANGVSTKSLDILQPGDKILFCMVEEDGPTEAEGHNGRLHMVKVLESELDDFASKHEYLRKGPGAIHIFREK